MQLFDAHFARVEMLLHNAHCDKEAAKSIQDFLLLPFDKPKVTDKMRLVEQLNREQAARRAAAKSNKSN